MSLFPVEDALRRALGPNTVPPPAGSDLLAAFTALGGPAWSASLSPSSETRAEAAAQVPGIDLAVWSRSDAARALLMLDWVRRTGAREAAADVAACYEQGDAAEQTSWLRALPLLPSPSQFTPLAIDACRTNIQPVFQALACENPFPAAHFPELNFNQMVLKALFNGVALDRIVGLAGRRNSELARMAGDYADERRAAGRSVPDDIGQVL